MRLAIARAAAVAVVLLALYAPPSAAQRRADLPGTPAPVSVYNEGGGAVPTLRSLFNSNTLRINNSDALSYNSGFAGEGVGLGVFTTSLRWQPSSRLAARVDVAAAHSPFGSDAIQNAMGFDENTPARVYLRNAELAYRPTENSMIVLQVQQSPFGAYASPYGYNPYGGYGGSGLGYSNGYGGGSTIRATFGAGDGDALFWRDNGGR